VSGSGINWAICKSAPRGHDVFTAKTLCHLPSESETGFTVNLNPDSIIKYPPGYRILQCFDAVGWASGRASGL